MPLLPRCAVALVATASLTAASCGTADPAETAGDSTPTPIESVDTGISIARQIDGDSLELDVEGDVVEVRLLGINAPELADCQGPSARDALADLLDAGSITIEGGETDRFGRELVWLRAAGVDVNRAMVATGWALANHGDGGDLVADMRRAADAGVGLWDPATPGCSAIDADVRFVDAEPDPAGPDDENINGEYVVLGNDGTAAVDLTDWILRDESTGNRFTLPAFVLGAGEQVTVRTGCGSDSDTEIFWCSDFPVWSNRGETALLLGPDGSYVTHLFF